MSELLESNCSPDANADLPENSETNAENVPPQKQFSDRRPELLTRVKYCNNLPDMPFDLKSIKYPLYPDRYVSYKPTLLERMYLCDLISDHDLGVEIDVIDVDKYKNNTQVQHHPIDAKLLEDVDAFNTPVSQRSLNHARSVSWLKRSEYISSEQARYQSKNSEKTNQESVRKRISEQPTRMDRNCQMKAIEKTFHDNKIPIEKHYSKPGIVPVEVMPVFPDFELWKYQCAQVIFDNDPAPVNKTPAEQIEMMSQAMMRGLMDESGEQFVAYFLPTEETLEKRKNDLETSIPYDDEYTYEYKMTKEYNWNVKTKASKGGYEENYFFVIRDKTIYYNELETKVRLVKRRCGTSGVTRLMVKHRPNYPAERRSLQRRQSRLEPLQEEEEDEEEDEEEKEEEKEEEVITEDGAEAKE